MNIITLDKNRKAKDWAKISEAKERSHRKLPWVHVDEIVSLGKCVMISERMAPKFPHARLSYLKYTKAIGKCDITREFGLCDVFLKELPK